ncbi:tripartite ATP-independent transporter DctM subunit [Dongia mobilis]|uniref:Tripartite ATP-independent transporter DctM subunit n=1 Tax=Dongia mobilis TaxID=578943 RepID=A0A4R6WTK6_9PROT|nr:TRAP transporter large permease subunit [Dongia mobilis]TDQ83378.1 tripartite ATP-independent transporter DctM subunit [Dongia mobilis]
MRKELWFGFTLMAIILIGAAVILPPPSEMESGHLGLLMLALIVVSIMLGFPTAFTLMGLGMVFTWMAFDFNTTHTLTLMVQRTYGVMSNDVLIAVPLFVFMGYLVERANLIQRLFTSLHLATAWLPGSLAVATLITCAIFATATGIVGAVVTLMGLLAFPAMLKAGYDIRLSAGAITAGGCLGILIPPSVLLIVYGATAGVSVVQLYAGAFFPGLMLTALYVLAVVLVSWIWPKLAPPLPPAEREVVLPPLLASLSGGRRHSWAPLRLLRAAFGQGPVSAAPRVWRELLLLAIPALTFALLMGLVYRGITEPPEAFDSGLVEMGSGADNWSDAGGLAEPPLADGLAEPPVEGGLAEPPLGDTLAEPPLGDALAEPPLAVPEPTLSEPVAEQPASTEAADSPARVPAPGIYWWVLAAGIACLGVFYALLNFPRYQIYRLLLQSFVPLSVLILAVLGSIVFGLATPTEAAAIGALGGALLAVAYRQMNWVVLRESVYLTAKTSAMVCWLFVGSAIFSAAFALLGGQDLIENWVLGLNLTPIEFMLLSQVIIFILGWPLEWTEIIVIFMPIFIPLLSHFNIDPLFFGLMVALNLQTAFLSPPVAMAAFYLKGVAPPHVTLNQIFAGMIPFMLIQVVAMFLLYMFPAIGLWLPSVIYR